MAEETKKTEEVKEEQKEPKEVFEYVVKGYDNGQYAFEGQILEGAEVPSIDQYHIALDIVSLGRKLDHQLTVEEATQRATQEIFMQLQQAAMAQAEAAKEPVDPTKAN